ncbi:MULTISPECIES: CAP domain-containing protein [Streptomyces]|uniref:CAP domain-containing protein n=1 Tax=Streptomyces TaxID=1883 RepID=UPI0015F9B46E|nr:MULTISPECIES: CAP domain-containing protein [unclassified Streptomyces]MCZ2525001.1 CAP domain-containing protein [Streptomyces sp. HB2AG]
MPKHRKSPRHRKIAVTVAAAMAVGTPSVAFASGAWNDDWSWQESWSRQGEEKDRSHGADRAHDWRDGKGDGGSYRDGGRDDSADAKDGYGGAWSKPGSEPVAKESAKAGTPAPKAPSDASAPGAASPGKDASAPEAPSSGKTWTKDSWTKAPSSPGTSAPAPSATGGSTSAAPAASDAVKRVLELVNAERGKVGCAPLSLNDKLMAAAQAHSEDMAAHRNMSHTGSDGSSPSERIKRAGYTAGASAENVAYGYSTPEKVMDGWMTSDGHRRNILNCSYKDIGIGLAQPGNYWTQDFGTSR